jgi:hypothetical protein
MSVIDNPLIAKFSNEIARVSADQCVSAYWTCKRALSLLEASGLEGIIPATDDPIVDGATLADGSLGDGRSQCTGNKLHALFATMRTIVAFAEATDGAVLNAMTTLSVNGQSRV